MASVTFRYGSGYGHVEYSIASGEIRSFELDGKTLYDRDNNIAAAANWLPTLRNIVISQAMDLARPKYAFVRKLQADGTIPTRRRPRDT